MDHATTARLVMEKARLVDGKHKKTIMINDRSIWNACLIIRIAPEVLSNAINIRLIKRHVAANTTTPTTLSTSKLRLKKGDNARYLRRLTLNRH